MVVCLGIVRCSGLGADVLCCHMLCCAVLCCTACTCCRAAGSVDVSIKGSHVSTVGAGQFFGEASLLKNVPCNATVRVTTPSLFLCYHRTAFLDLVSRYESIRAGLQQHVEGCTATSLLMFDVFACLPEEDRTQRLDAMSNLITCVAHVMDE